MTVVSLPTAFWHELLHGGRDSIAPDIRMVCVGGDKVGTADIQHWFELGEPMPRLFNGYGPTECSVSTTFAEVDARYPESIGKAIGNVQLYVLNPQMALAPTGLAGELYIGGDCLARGYWQQADLTAAAFVDNPFYQTGQPETRRRLYKTGDLVRWLPNGELQFIGRVDYQVKVRGFQD